MKRAPRRSTGEAAVEAAAVVASAANVLAARPDRPWDHGQVGRVRLEHDHHAGGEGRDLCWSAASCTSTETVVPLGLNGRRPRC